MKKTKKVKILLTILSVILLISVIVIATLVVNKNKQNSQEESQHANNVKQQDENAIVDEYVQILEDGRKLNISTKLNETKEVDGLTFENIQFTEQDGKSLLLANVTNNSGKALDTTLVDVILLYKDGRKITTLKSIISPLQPGESTQFIMSTSVDYTNAYDFKIILQK